MYSSRSNQQTYVHQLRFRTALNATGNSNFFLDDVTFVAKSNAPGESTFELFLPLTVKG